MFICRLFYRDRPFEQVEARLLAEGSITVGRDPSSDWPLPDPDITLSRHHCTLTVEDGRLLLRDTSTNGTLVDGQPAPRDQAVPLLPRQTVSLGALIIVIDQPAAEAATGAATTVIGGIEIAHTPAPDQWTDGQAVSPPTGQGSLLDAFCEGAGLDVSAFSGEEPYALMRRAGAIYKQSVLGLATLMADRARVKSQAELDRTTIAATANNPIKWTPSRRLGQALLSPPTSGFLPGDEAMRAALEDLGRHMAGLAQAAQAATELVAQTLAPESIEAEAREQGGFLRNQQALRWEAYERRYGALIDGQGDNAIRRAFVEAYGRATEPPRS